MLEAVQVSTAIAEYSKTESALAELAGRYKGLVFDVTSGTGMASARKARAEIRGYRTSLENMRVEIKAPALERCRLIDSEAKRITKALFELEDPIDRQIENEKERKGNELLAKERAEAERIAADQRAIKEAEEMRLAQERAEIARRQAELNKAEQERFEVEKAARLKIEAEERAARMRIEEQERAARSIREEADRKAKEAREAEDARLKAELNRVAAERRAIEERERKAREAARVAEEANLKAERDKIEAERRQLEEAQRKERAAEEAKQREILRLQNEILDAREMLENFRDRFNHIPEFEAVIKAIDICIGKAVSA